MISEEEKNDLQLLVKQSDKVAADFCKLSIESLKDDINPKVYVSAASKLNVSPIQIEKVIHALLNIFLKVTEKDINDEEFGEALSQVIFPPSVVKSIVNTYVENKCILKENLEKLAVKVPEYKELDWRFDIITKTRSLNDVTEPVVTLQLKLGNKGTQTEQNHHFQVDPSTLIHMTETLEEAIQQARSHHIRKFKKEKKSK